MSDKVEAKAVDALGTKRFCVTKCEVALLNMPVVACMEVAVPRPEGMRGAERHILNVRMWAVAWGLPFAVQHTQVRPGSALVCRRFVNDIRATVVATTTAFGKKQKEAWET